jgi:hypothetical protein
MTTAILDEFIDRCDGETFRSAAEVDAACETLGVSESDFIEALAMRVAERYAVREMSFDRADALMNGVHSYYLLKYDGMLPGIADDIYLAFDAGEYYRGADGREIDPSEKYTRPEIEAILSAVRNR